MTMLAPARRAAVRAAIHATFPGCPDDVVDRFLGLAEVATETLAAQACTILEKPYGRNHILCDTGAFGLSFACMRPGQTTSLHTHAERREFFLVRCGRLTLRTPPTEEILEPGAYGRSVPGVAHALSNRGSAPLEFLEIFSPLLLDDKYRISDPYHRATGQVGLYE